MRFLASAICVLLTSVSILNGAGPETWRLPLSGEGPADAVDWDFRVTGGRRAGEQAKIPVPSQWEQHGFGNYDYGSVPAEDKHKEDGIYQRRFIIPADWKERRIRIVFDGVMTDATVTINGKSAGPTHQGGFYRFHYDITDLVRFGGENRLEVLVSKDSANESIEGAERGADYWVFGGIFRPVWLEARPPRFIEWTAIDARADGTLRASVTLDGIGPADRLLARVLAADGKEQGSPLETRIGEVTKITLEGRIPDVKPWSAETPTIYRLEIALMNGDKTLHLIEQRFGFRTMETRPGQGVFLNGKRITVKGVNRHCFRAASGRALNPQDSLDDVRLIKEMNMNAVRCSHYPPDKAFLEACDELGLYVVDELCTWQQPKLDTPSARRLVGELIRRDVNHPSILWWANGNEGGWNTEVDGDYAKWDPQKRPVLHPWEEFSGYQTKHYPTWERLKLDLADKFLVMPTEYLHGLYDGGHGAGLEDYWNAITSRPNGVGGFLWVLADEGIARTDRNGEIDNWATNAPDGIVGPKHEKEASFSTIKDIFCPVQIAMKRIPDGFNGRIAVRNGYDFRNLAGVRFAWNLSDENPEGGHSAGGVLPGPAVEAGGSGFLEIPLPDNWRDSATLALRADDAEGNELWTWCWPIADSTAESQADPVLSGVVVKTEEENGTLRVTSGDTRFTFSAASGRLENVMVGVRAFPLVNGPRLVSSGSQAELPLNAAKVVKVTASGAEGNNVPGNIADDSDVTRWSQAGRDAWIMLELDEPSVIDAFAVCWQHAKDRKASWMFEVSEDGSNWIQAAEGPSRPELPNWDTRNIQPRTVRFARLRCFGNNINEWNSILELKIGRRDLAAKPGGFSVRHRMIENGACRIEAESAGPFKSYAWTIRPGGTLELEYFYQLNGTTLYHGITFDLEESSLIGFSWLGQGPERVWANRMRGTRFGSFTKTYRKLRPGLDYDYPHFAGFHADVHHAAIHTKSGSIRVQCHQQDTFLRIGTNDEGQHINTTWPEGDFSALHAIPAIGNKFHKPELIGPQSAPHSPPGPVRGKLSFRFAP